MRTTVFAFLGLTAATGMAIVALFAQLSFPVLSPAPMPAGPKRANAVADAEVARGAPLAGRPSRGKSIGHASGRRRSGDGATGSGSAGAGFERARAAPTKPERATAAVLPDQGRSNGPSAAGHAG